MTSLLRALCDSDCHGTFLLGAGRFRRSASPSVLLLVVRDGRLDRVLGEDRAVNLHRAEASQLLDDLRVRESPCASSTFLPLIHSVASDEDAIAEPHPNVLNLASTIVSPSTWIWSFITSPHSGAPTMPVPTSVRLLVEGADVPGVVVVGRGPCRCMPWCCLGQAAERRGRVRVGVEPEASAIRDAPVNDDLVHQ